MRFATIAADLSYKLKPIDQLKCFIAGLPSNLQIAATQCCAITPNISISELARFVSSNKPSLSVLSQHSFLIPLVTEYRDDKAVLTSLLLINKAIRDDLKGYCVKQFVRQRITNGNRYLPVRVRCIHDVTSLPISDYGDNKWKEIRLGYCFNEQIAIGTIPESVTHLHFGYKFNQPIEVGSIPSSVTHLHFGYQFNQHITIGVIPASVTDLDLGDDFSQFIPAGAIPGSVTNLTFSREFNQPIAVGTIPDSVTNLNLGWMFNQLIAVGAVPVSVTCLNFGYRFNQPIAVLETIDA